MSRRAAEDFWSRRKAAVRAEEEAAAARARTLAEARDAAGTAGRHAGRSEEEILRELDLPAPESLGPGDDFAAYLSRAVPEQIRRRALRRLWRVNPVLANLDGLVDHGEDFTDAAMASGAVASAYRVGRGMIDRIAEAAAEPLPEAAGEGRAPRAGAAPEAAIPEPAAPESAPDDAAAVAAGGGDAPESGRPRRPRHMVFTFSSSSREASA
ncbi:DUF3306 domain-containing protein [Albidovulum sp.]